MPRWPAWLLLIALLAGARWFDSPALRAAGVPVLLLALALGAPVLRTLLLSLAAAALAAIALGHGDAALDLAPALVAGVIGWLFARTLIGGRRPLIARMIAAIDGAAMLDDPAIARYARRLTLAWACYQAALALAAAALAVHVWWCPQHWAALPGPRTFGIVLLPGAVLALLLAEFTLRERLLPQAPRRSLAQFARALVRAWPAALAD